MAMSSEEIPVIDFRRTHDGGLEPGTCEWQELTDQMIHASQTWGCFRILYDLPEKLYTDIFSLSKDVFELPIETKKKHKANKPFFGYLGNDPLFPLYESMSTEAEPESIKGLVELLWPGGNTKASETLKSFYGEIAKMDLIIRQMILEGLGVGNLYKSMLKSTQAHCSLLKYVPPLPGELDISLRPHTDPHFLTIIFQDDTGGLDYQSKDGSWIPISPMPNSFIVLLGDSFKAWSNDRLHHARHRVVVNRGKERFSFTFFVKPNDGVPVAMPEELVDSDHPRFFRPYDYAEYMAYAFNADETVKPALYSFAGIKAENLETPLLL